MNIKTLLSSPSWNIEKIKFFITHKIYDENNNLNDSLEFDDIHIMKIEASPQFSLFDDLTYNQMKDYHNECDMLFTQNTLSLVSLIEKNPHNFELSDEDFTKDNCVIMVDASLKKYGDQEHACIAGCIRDSAGRVVLGFRKKLQRDVLTTNDSSFNTSVLEFNGLLEGLEIAAYFKLKNYIITSDCIGNVISINKAKYSIPSLSSDYFNQKELYDKILNQLIEDNAHIVYIPRNYNNIADDFSKSYQKKMGELFELESTQIYSRSLDVLKGNISYELKYPIYFHHETQFNHNKKHNPYDMIKNVHLEHIVNLDKQPHYDKYLLSFINTTKGYHYKYVFHFLVDPITQHFSPIYIDVPDNLEEAPNIVLLKSMAKVIPDLEVDNLGILCSIGMNAILNRIIPLSEKDFDAYQELYHSLNHVEHWGAFLRSETTGKNILLWINDYIKKENQQLDMKQNKILSKK